MPAPVPSIALAALELDGAVLGCGTRGSAPCVAAGQVDPVEAVALGGVGGADRQTAVGHAGLDVGGLSEASLSPNSPTVRTLWSRLEGDVRVGALELGLEDHEGALDGLRVEQDGTGPPGRLPAPGPDAVLASGDLDLQAGRRAGCRPRRRRRRDRRCCASPERRPRSPRSRRPRRSSPPRALNLAVRPGGLVRPHHDLPAVARIDCVRPEARIPAHVGARGRRKVALSVGVSADQDLAAAGVARGIDGGAQHGHAVAGDDHRAADATVAIVRGVQRAGHLHQAALASCDPDVAAPGDPGVVGGQRIDVAGGQHHLAAARRPGFRCSPRPSPLGRGSGRRSGSTRGRRASRGRPLRPPPWRSSRRGPRCGRGWRRSGPPGSPHRRGSCRRSRPCPRGP